MDTNHQPEPHRRRRTKKIKVHGHHHGGSWKVAYADFVTAMMALFLVLWLVSQGDMRLKQSLANYFRSPGVFDKVQQGGITDGVQPLAQPDHPPSDKEMLEATADILQKKFTTMPELLPYKNQVKIDITDQGLRIQVVDEAEQVSFRQGSAALTPAARRMLAEIAQTICPLANPIQIGGHTDSYTYPGMNYTNWELSCERANAARRALEEACIPAQRIHRVVGYADTELLVPDQPFAPSNRRISIILLNGEVTPDTAFKDKASGGRLRVESFTRDHRNAQAGSAPRSPGK